MIHENSARAERTVRRGELRGAPRAPRRERAVRRPRRRAFHGDAPHRRQGHGRPSAGRSCSTRWPSFRSPRRRSCCSCCSRGATILSARVGRSRADVRVDRREQRRSRARRRASSRFRADLFYRLHVVPIRVPSLDERRDDIEDLAMAFCAHAVARHASAEDRPVGARDPDAAAMEWPGNVRQLEHAVEAAVIRAAAQGAAQSRAGALMRVPESAATAGTLASRSKRRPDASRPSSCGRRSRTAAGTWSSRRAASTSRARISTT